MYKKKIITLAVMGFVIVLLSVALWIVKHPKIPYVLEVPKESVTKITWQLRGREKITIEKDRDYWKCGDVYLKQVFEDDIFNSIAKVESIKEIKNYDSLEKYGLNPAEISIDIETQTSQHTILIGSDVEGGKSHYIKLADSDSVYLISSKAKLKYAFNYLPDIFVKAQTEEDVHMITVTQIPEETIKAVKWNVRGEGDIEIIKDTDGVFKCNSIPLKENFKESILNSLAEIRSEQEIDNYANLGQYGLEHPYISIDVEMEDGTYTILLSDFDVVQKIRYMKVSDSEIIYKIPSTEGVLYAFDHRPDVFIEAQK